MAKLTGISKSALGNYENDDYKEINHGNLVTLAQFYNVSTDYLLCLTENKNHPNTDLTNLHLSDDMIDLLLSCSFNNRLLFESATHYKFKKLIAGTDIFVDCLILNYLMTYILLLKQQRLKSLLNIPVYLMIIL